MADLKVGDPAPDFEMMNQDRQTVRLSDFLGKKKVVLLFYPMDFSPVCTQEHCEFGPQLPKIAGAEDAVVFGVSCDSPFCHAAFKKQYKIPYDLLSDVTRSVSKAYNLFMGELPYNCSKRGTVVIDKDGRIAHWHEQPTKEARKVEELARAVAG
ncbi:redoxin domain-containing protein [Fontivita pretiosa]|uniref:redoxin domain-containing protein n=1 Tax=Fontivita pretiosa TaxID=2989684 RepID=UPI003D17E6FE